MNNNNINSSAPHSPNLLNTNNDNNSNKQQQLPLKTYFLNKYEQLNVINDLRWSVVTPFFVSSIIHTLLIFFHVYHYFFLIKNPSNLLAAAATATTSSNNKTDLPVDNNNTRSSSSAVLSKRLYKDLLSIEINIKLIFGTTEEKPTHSTVFLLVLVSIFNTNNNWKIDIFIN